MLLRTGRRYRANIQHRARPPQNNTFKLEGEFMHRLIIIFALVSCSAGVAFAQEAGKARPTPPKTLSLDSGRFVFGQLSELRRDQYMLDTKTGRLWQKVIAKVGKPGEETEVSVLEPIYFVGPDGKWYEEPKLRLLLTRCCRGPLS